MAGSNEGRASEQARHTPETRLTISRCMGTLGLLLTYSETILFGYVSMMQIDHFSSPSIRCQSSELREVKEMIHDM